MEGASTTCGEVNHLSFTTIRPVVMTGSGSRLSSVLFDSFGLCDCTDNHDYWNITGTITS